MTHTHSYYVECKFTRFLKWARVFSLHQNSTTNWMEKMHTGAFKSIFVNCEPANSILHWCYYALITVIVIVDSVGSAHSVNMWKRVNIHSPLPRQELICSLLCSMPYYRSPWLTWSFFRVNINWKVNYCVQWIHKFRSKRINTQHCQTHTLHLRQLKEEIIGFLIIFVMHYLLEKFIWFKVRQRLTASQ